MVNRGEHVLLCKNVKLKKLKNVYPVNYSPAGPWNQFHIMSIHEGAFFVFHVGTVLGLTSLLNDHSSPI